MADETSEQLRKKWGQGFVPGWADAIYYLEIDRQCSFSKRAYDEMRTLLKKTPDDSWLLGLAHSMLAHAGIVNKLLFVGKGATPDAKARAQRLAAAMGVDEKEFTEIVDARNYLEHFDERMDRHMHSHEGMLAHEMVADHEVLQIQLLDGRKMKPSFLQFFNTSTFELTCYGTTYSLVRVWQLIHRVHQAALRERTRIESEMGRVQRPPGEH